MMSLPRRALWVFVACGLHEVVVQPSRTSKHRRFSSGSGVPDREVDRGYKYSAFKEVKKKKFACSQSLAGDDFFPVKLDHP